MTIPIVKCPRLCKIKQQLCYKPVLLISFYFTFLLNFLSTYDSDCNYNCVSYIHHHFL